MSTLIQLKAANDSRLTEEKKTIERRRNILILIAQFCREYGYLQTAEKLQQEGGLAFSKFDVVENIDLMRIVQEFEEYEEIKFGRRPKLVRRRISEEQDKCKSLASKRAARIKYSSPQIAPEAQVENSVAFKLLHQMNSTKLHNVTELSTGVKNENADLELVGQKPTKQKVHSVDKSNAEVEDSVEDRLLKPLPVLLHDSDLRPLAETISREIFQQNPNVKWNDVIGLEETKRLLKEAVVMPLRYPQIFKGLLSPWSGILLYGPPGNGKTMLAKAVATECKTTFFNISASSIVSKYRGDSEKLIRILFELARYHAPSTIFLDEVDSIMGQRDSSGSGGQEHEASRRMKTELLIQMDGLSKGSEVVFVLTASNLPWELDMAMLRRLEKRVLVDVPSAEARRAHLESLLKPYVPTTFDFERGVSKTEGYSGADLKLVAKEACMAPVRRLLKKLEEAECDATQPNAFEQAHASWQDIVGFVEPEDLTQALEKSKPSTQHFVKKYQHWQAKFGSI
uniref:Katanin p60 ATPase-containing subunit A-like 2 n=1 Tax=Albugo laibachii Nc14 TaxID=890382 RepID=F0WCC3_9STRA|nr:katanin p60 ATPasecontaining subunit A putative [Albugo laibachii Nc14]|eukprot:CCA18838.1 katanin p60 ATPasecontaining subunit A putative [Albugo laibachii Nc14]